MKLIFILSLFVFSFAQSQQDDNVFFMLFTRQNPIVGQRIGFNSEDIINSNWNPAHDVRILCHGYVSSYRVIENVVTTVEFLRRNDYNVIAVDWSAIAHDEFDDVIPQIPGVGAVVGRFIDFLRQHGFTQYQKVNLIGHSFGSHVAGFAGKNTQHGKVNAIFATDPSARVGTVEDPASRLDSSDAEYVEAIISSVRGFRQPIAHVTFYPNWGVTQPGCELDQYCDHHRATEFYTESVNSDRFVARMCENFDEIEAENCPGVGTFTSLGGDHAKDVRGVFFLETNAESPFARG